MISSEDSRKGPSAIPETELELNGQATSTILVEAATSFDDAEASHYLTGWRLYTLSIG